MADADVDAAQASVDEQAKWGETHDSRAIARLVKWAKRAVDRLDTTRDAIVDLRARVKALEDKTP
jgi:hypothetical protein